MSCQCPLFQVISRLDASGGTDNSKLKFLVPKELFAKQRGAPGRARIKGIILDKMQN